MGVMALTELFSRYYSRYYFSRCSGQTWSQITVPRAAKQNSVSITVVTQV